MSNPQRPEWPDEQRIDTIGQNGNTGDHYRPAPAMPDHIARIIERIEPADREALEQHLKDESIMGQLMCLQEIRQAIGDPWGRLMQDEVVSAISSLVKERDEYLDHLKQICEIVGEVHDGKHDIGVAWESVAAIKHQRDELETRTTESRERHPDQGVCTACCGYGYDDVGDVCDRCAGGGHEPTEHEQ